jgi:hypothetical protein
MTPQLTPEQRESIAAALYQGQKIAAIKQLRELSGLGLKESKDIIDRLEADLRQAHPERFTAPVKGGIGVGAIVLFLLVDAAIVILYFIFRR